MMKILFAVTSLVVGAYLFIENRPQEDLTENSAPEKNQTSTVIASKANPTLKVEVNSTISQRVDDHADPVEQNIKMQADSAIEAGYITADEREDFEQHHREFAQMQAQKAMDEMTEQYDEQL